MSKNNMIIMFAKDVYYSTILYGTFVGLNAIILNIIVYHQFFYIIKRLWNTLNFKRMKLIAQLMNIDMRKH